MSQESENKSNRKFGIGEWIGVVGVLLAVVTWLHGTKSREFSISVDVPVTEIVKSGVSSDIAINFKGALVSGSLRAYQVAVWNAGREPIRKEDVLKPIKISWQTGSKVLDVKFVKLTREETGLQLTRAPENLEIDLKILEQNDGGLLQFLVVGDETLSPTIEGSIVGQGRLGASTFKLANPFRGNALASRLQYWLLVASLFAMTGLSARQLWFVYRGEHKERNQLVPMIIIGFIFLISLFALFSMIYRFGLFASPFGF